MISRWYREAANIRPWYFFLNLWVWNGFFGLGVLCEAWTFAAAPSFTLDVSKSYFHEALIRLLLCQLCRLVYVLCAAVRTERVLQDAATPVGVFKWMSWRSVMLQCCYFLLPLFNISIQELTLAAVLSISKSKHRLIQVKLLSCRFRCSSTLLTGNSQTGSPTLLSHTAESVMDLKFFCPSFLSCCAPPLIFESVQRRFVQKRCSWCSFDLKHQTN